MSWNQNDNSNMIKIEDTHGLNIDNMNVSFRYSYKIK